MRKDRWFTLLNGNPYMIDFANGRQVPIPSEIKLDPNNIPKIFNHNDINDSFSSWLRQIKYLDYSNYDEVLSIDSDKNKIQHQHSKQPNLSISEQYKVTESYAIGLPFSVVDDVDAYIVSAVFSAFSSIGERDFHQDRVLIKNVPSVGSRHGIELHFEKNGEYYYYDPQKNIFMLIGNKNIDEGIRLHLGFRPEVYMWRYGSQCLLDIYYDLGHILGNIHIISIIYGRTVVYYPDDELPSEFNFPIITPLGSILID